MHANMMMSAYIATNSALFSPFDSGGGRRSEFKNICVLPLKEHVFGIQTAVPLVTLHSSFSPQTAALLHSTARQGCQKGNG